MSNDTKTPEQIAKVRAGATMTLNVGNYESIKVEAGVEMPCAPSEVAEEFKKAWAEVYRQLDVRIAEIRNGRRNGNGNS